jgi:signal transduction histidine kinase
VSSLLSTLQELPDDELLPLARHAAIGSLSGGVAHDAGNALFGILGLLDLATAGEPVDPERLRLLRLSASDLDALLRPLLRFAHGERGRSTGDLAAATREALELYRRGDRKDLQVEGEIPDRPVPVTCDPALLVQAAVHLLLAAAPARRLEVDVGAGRLRVGPAGEAESIDTLAAERIAAGAGGELARDERAFVLHLPGA